MILTSSPFYHSLCYGFFPDDYVPYPLGLRSDCECVSVCCVRRPDRCVWWSSRQVAKIPVLLTCLSVYDRPHGEEI